MFFAARWSREWFTQRLTQWLRQRPWLAKFAVLSLVVTGSGCSGGGTASPETPTTTTALAGVILPGGSVVDPGSVVGPANATAPGLLSGAATIAPALSPTPGTGPAIVLSAYAQGLSTPEAASKNLWDSWRDGDRTRALSAADASAVDDLFATPWGPEIAEQGCSAVVTNLKYRCAFVEGDAGWLIDVAGEASRYRVIRVAPWGTLPDPAGATPSIRPGPTGGPTTARPRPIQPKPAATETGSTTPGTGKDKTGKDKTGKDKTGKDKTGKTGSSQTATTKAGSIKKKNKATATTVANATRGTAPPVDPTPPADSVPDRVPVRAPAP